ncbi:MAG: hypothetical protein KJO49_00615 [Bacteroidia bacterium]|nr:hypothetical protein [Bacteroidia bacterium]NNF83215.1 hypothetical protein [Flavobacteriaceae bacterium]NNK69390.1 hypothetical protein [Flavobacteriaceae bacterium]NNL80308.1 hypothetical protein [Flavobacteriaceae bacterium]
MRSIVLRKEIDPLPIQQNIPVIETYEGILNSEFKKVAKTNFFNSKPKSIFATRQRLKSYQHHFTTNAETLVKLSVFAIVLAVVLL